MNDYEFEDARNPTMVVVAAEGNKDDGENNRNNDDDKQTSSVWSNFIDSKNSFSHTTAPSVNY
jgi:hypothetical protein